MCAYNARERLLRTRMPLQKHERIETRTRDVHIHWARETDRQTDRDREGQRETEIPSTAKDHYIRRGRGEKKERKREGKRISPS